MPRSAKPPARTPRPSAKSPAHAERRSAKTRTTRPSAKPPARSVRKPAKPPARPVRKSAKPPEPDWKAVERLVRTSSLSLQAIAKQLDVPGSTLRARAAAGQWRTGLSKPQPRARRWATGNVTSRRALIRRFYRAIDTKLKQMELRMQSDMEKGDDGASAADHERDTRAIGGLINQLGKISEYEADLNRPAAQGEELAAVAAEAERYRRELAERLARLIPPAG